MKPITHPNKAFNLWFLTCGSDSLHATCFLRFRTVAKLQLWSISNMLVPLRTTATTLDSKGGFLVEGSASWCFLCWIVKTIERCYFHGNTSVLFVKLEVGEGSKCLVWACELVQQVSGGRWGECVWGGAGWDSCLCGHKVCLPVLVLESIRFPILFICSFTIENKTRWLRRLKCNILH